MSDIEVHELEELVLPHTGEVVSLHDPFACTLSLVDIRNLETRLKEIKHILTNALVEESQRQGSKTINLPGGLKAEVRGGQKVLWDAQALEEGLRKAGMPENRIRTLVKEEVSYSVVAGEAKRAAGANPEYASIIESCSTTIEERPTISVRKR